MMPQLLKVGFTAYIFISCTGEMLKRPEHLWRNIANRQTCNSRIIRQLYWCGEFVRYLVPFGTNSPEHYGRIIWVLLAVHDFFERCIVLFLLRFVAHWFRCRRFGNFDVLRHLTFAILLVSSLLHLSHVHPNRQLLKTVYLQHLEQIYPITRSIQHRRLPKHVCVHRGPADRTHWQAQRYVGFVWCQISREDWCDQT